MPYKSILENGYAPDISRPLVTNERGMTATQILAAVGLSPDFWLVPPGHSKIGHKGDALIGSPPTEPQTPQISATQRIQRRWSRSFVAKLPAVVCEAGDDTPHRQFSLSF